MDRPTGVSVVSVLMWIIGILNIIVGLVAIGPFPVLGVISLALGIAAIAFGVGIWQLQEWAWAGTLVLEGLDAISRLYLLFRGGAGSAFGRIVGLILNIVIIVYLLQPDVRRVFRKEATF
jgi:hypothetical protein